MDNQSDKRETVENGLPVESSEVDPSCTAQPYASIRLD